MLHTGRFLVGLPIAGSRWILARGVSRNMEIPESKDTAMRLFIYFMHCI